MVARKLSVCERFRKKREEASLRATRAVSAIRVGFGLDNEVKKFLPVNTLRVLRGLGMQSNVNSRV